MEILGEIRRLKREKDAIVLAHNYTPANVQLTADFIGDSLELARTTMESKSRMVVLCGVDFMAETVKILNPEKKVLVPDMSATCPLAGMVDPCELAEERKRRPEATVVSYVNTTARTKAQSDICCTSSNAIEVVRSLPGREVIFIPDRNLGQWVKRCTMDKEITLWHGSCYVHTSISLKGIKKIKDEHPDAVVIAHPECNPDVLEAADMVLSTGGMVRFARESREKEFIVATEEGLCSRLSRENPSKSFYPFPEATCRDMKKNTLEKVLECLERERDEILVEEDLMKKAREPLLRMMKIA